MPEMLLINPRKRRGSSSKKRTSARRRRRNPIANIRSASRARGAARIVNPRRRRRSSMALFRRRRRNPIRVGGQAKAMLSQLMSAAVGAGGAVAIDLAWSKVAPNLPASLQIVKGSPGLGDGVKLVATALLGKLLKRATKGYSEQAALGAMTVQVHGLVMGMLPASMQVQGLRGMGYYSPAPIAQGTNRVGPVRQGMNAYARPGVSPVLGSYARPGQTQLLNASPRVREGMNIR